MVNRTGPDVICAGMYRACSTWQYEVAAHLVEEHCRRPPSGIPAQRRVHGSSGPGRRNARAATKIGRGWRVIKAHEGERAMASELSAGELAALYAYRDVRDVVFSLMHKRGKTFEEILRQGMIHQILGNDRFWMAQPNVLVQRYEDLISEPARGVTELAKHLGFELEAGEAERIAALYSQESNRARTDGAQAKARAGGRGSREYWQYADLRSIVAVALESHAAKRRRLLADRGDAAAEGNSAPAVRPLARVAGLFSGGTPATRWDLSANGVRGSLRSEVDVMVGLADFLVRTTSLRFPQTARTVKRMLGMPVEAKARATVWADPIPVRSTSTNVSEEAA